MYRGELARLRHPSGAAVAASTRRECSAGRGCDGRRRGRALFCLTVGVPPLESRRHRASASHLGLIIFDARAAAAAGDAAAVPAASCSPSPRRCRTPRAPPAAVAGGSRLPLRACRRHRRHRHQPRRRRLERSPPPSRARRRTAARALPEESARTVLDVASTALEADAASTSDAAAPRRPIVESVVASASTFSVETAAVDRRARISDVAVALVRWQREERRGIPPAARTRRRSSRSRIGVRVGNGCWMRWSAEERQAAPVVVSSDELDLSVEVRRADAIAAAPVTRDAEGSAAGARTLPADVLDAERAATTSLRASCSSRAPTCAAASATARTPRRAPPAAREPSRSSAGGGSSARRGGAADPPRPADGGDDASRGGAVCVGSRAANDRPVDRRVCSRASPPTPALCRHRDSERVGGDRSKLRTRAARWRARTATGPRDFAQRQGDRRLRDRRGGRRLRPVRVLAPERVYRRRGAAVVGRAHRRHPRRPRGADEHVGRRRAVPRPRRVARCPLAVVSRPSSSSSASRTASVAIGARLPLSRRSSLAGRATRSCGSGGGLPASCSAVRRRAAAQAQPRSRAERVAAATHDRALLHGASAGRGRTPRRLRRASCRRLGSLRSLSSPRRLATATCGARWRCRRRRRRRRAAWSPRVRTNSPASLANVWLERRPSSYARTSQTDEALPDEAELAPRFSRAAVAAALATAFGAHDDARVDKAREARADGAAGRLDYSGTNRWRRARMLKTQIVLCRRWHRDVDRWYKSLLAVVQGLAHARRRPLLSRRAGFTRAQSVQILLNSLVLEVGARCACVLGRRRRSIPISHCRRPHAGRVRGRGDDSRDGGLRRRVHAAGGVQLVMLRCSCAGALLAARRDRCVRALCCWPCAARRAIDDRRRARVRRRGQRPPPPHRAARRQERTPQRGDDGVRRRR